MEGGGRVSETRTGRKTLQQTVKTHWRTEMPIYRCQALETMEMKFESSPG